MNPAYTRLRSLGYRTFKELDEALAAGTINSYGLDEVKQAKALERALFPKNIRYPKEGEVYTAREDVEINYLTTWEAPYTGGGKAVLPKNERIIVEELFEEQPVTVACNAVNYKMVEQIIIPKAERESIKYSGYYISVGTLTLNQKFDLVENI